MLSDWCGVEGRAVTLGVSRGGFEGTINPAGPMDT